MDSEFCEFKHMKNKNEILSKAYYHITCFRDKLNGGQNLRELQEKANKILDLAHMKVS